MEAAELSAEASILLAEMHYAKGRGEYLDFLAMMKIVSRPDRALRELEGAGLIRRIAPRVYEAVGD